MRGKFLIIILLSFVVFVSGCTKPAPATDEGPIVDTQKEPADCEKLQDKLDKSLCYYGIGISKQDTSLCDKAGLPGEEDRRDAYRAGQNRDQCYSSVAQSKKDISICEAIKDKLIWGRCQYIIVKGQNDPALCVEIKHQGFKDDCYYDLAIDAAFTGSKDISLCDGIKDKAQLGQCQTVFIKEIGDPALCETIKDQAVKDTCYYNLAISKEDTSLCEKIQESTDKDQCYWVLAISKEDTSLCEKVQDKYSKSLCIQGVIPV